MKTPFPSNKWHPRIFSVFNLWSALFLYIMVHIYAKYGWFYMPSDDSYIYLGYVKMAITKPYELFSYNPGEHSGGVTGILYYYFMLIVSLFLRPFTFHLDIPAALTLGAYLGNGVLFVLLGGLAQKTWTALKGTREKPGFLETLLLFSIICANYKFLWGFFGGLENPLTATLLVLLFYLLLSGRPVWMSVSAAAGLAMTRPELIAVMSLMPLLAIYTARKSFIADNKIQWQPMLLKLFFACLLFGGLLVAGHLPLYIYTDNFLPTSLGTRVKFVFAIFSVKSYIANIKYTIVETDFWQSQWHIYNYVMIALSLVLTFMKRHRQRAMPVFVASVLILLNFVVRASFGLTDLNVQDRYISYIWPIYALSILFLVYLVLSGLVERLNALLKSKAVRTIAVSILAALSIFSISNFQGEFDLDVQEMNEIAVSPSKWMAQNLEPGSRISMEQAGAIRLYTDFYLIDNVGLTTKHVYSWKGGSDYEFAKAMGADYFFDHPVRVQEFNDHEKFQPLNFWIPENVRFGNGMRVVCKVL